MKISLRNLHFTSLSPPKLSAVCQWYRCMDTAPRQRPGFGVVETGSGFSKIVHYSAFFPLSPPPLSSSDATISVLSAEIFQ